MCRSVSLELYLVNPSFLIIDTLLISVLLQYISLLLELLEIFPRNILENLTCFYCVFLMKMIFKLSNQRSLIIKFSKLCCNISAVSMMIRSALQLVTLDLPKVSTNFLFITCFLLLLFEFLGPGPIKQSSSSVMENLKSKFYCSSLNEVDWSCAGSVTQGNYFINKLTEKFILEVSTFNFRNHNI